MSDVTTQRGSPTIAGVGRALPGPRLSQDEILEGLRGVWQGLDYDDGWLEHFCGAVGVEGRHLALPREEYFEIDDFGDANDRWIERATELGSEALAEAFERAGIDLREIDAIFFTTVTGVASPSIDARMINALELPRHVKRVPMFGLGCVGGAAGLGRVADYLRGHPDDVAALVSVELCSLTLERQEPGIPDLIAASLFGDGAAAVVCAGADRAGALDRPAGQIRDNRSVFYRDTEWVMGWEISAQGFELVLSGDLPEVIEGELEDDVSSFLSEHDLAVDDIARWISHPGGPKVLEAMESALHFEDGELASARRSLAEIGNLSSASVLSVLGDVLDEGRGPAEWGGPGVVMAMGPGFAAEFVLVD